MLTYRVSPIYQSYKIMIDKESLNKQQEAKKKKSNMFQNLLAKEIKERRL